MRHFLDIKNMSRDTATKNVFEILFLGSSKTKPPSRLFPIMSPQPLPATVAPPVHRQSRVELYENERKKLRQSTKFQSIKKLFKLGSNPNLTSVASAASETASNLSVRRNSISSSNNM